MLQAVQTPETILQPENSIPQCCLNKFSIEHAKRHLHVALPQRKQAHAAMELYCMTASIPLFVAIGRRTRAELLRASPQGCSSAVTAHSPAGLAGGMRAFLPCPLGTAPAGPRPPSSLPAGLGAGKPRKDVSADTA